MKSATRAFVREAHDTEDYSWFDLVHGYVYARWPYLYIGIATGEHPVARILRPVVSNISRLFPGKRTDARFSDAFADSYHGKVVPLAQASQLVTVNEDVTLTNLEQVVPYSQARDIILHNPDHITALECPCRAARADPCLPLDVCLIVGEPFASFVAQHHPRRSRPITSDEALEILAAEDRRGHVHHAFFKDAMLGRFYAICNCCSCCCGAMQAHQSGTPMLASSGFVAFVRVERCAGCGTCTTSCQFGALHINAGCDPETGSVAYVHRADCMGCGVCTSHCPNGALSLERDPSRGEPLDIHKLLDGHTTMPIPAYMV